LTEDFSSNKIPDNWTIEGKKDNWTIQPRKGAGGVAPELAFYYKPITTGTFRLISPAFNTKNISKIKLTFKQMFRSFIDSVKFGVATRAGGSDWKSIWEVDKNVTVEKEVIIPKETKQINITENLNSDNFQFCFYFIGNTNNIIAWAIDDILLEVPSVKIDKIEISENAVVDSPVTPIVTVRNKGSKSASFPVTLSIYAENQKLFTQTIQVSDLQAKNTKTLMYKNFIPKISNQLYKVVANTNLSGEQKKSNDTLNAYFNTYDKIEKMILWESFTNTGCHPCAAANPINIDMIKKYRDRIVPLFLHTDFPSSKDPFNLAIKEVLKARLTYYNINGVPRVFMNGTYTKIVGDVAKFDDYIAFEKNKFSPIKMKISGKISGDKFISKVEIDPIADAAPAIYKLHVGITESNIKYKALNGETDFPWTLRNLYPSAYGTKIDIIKKGSKIVKNIECSIDPSWKKENLKVIAFVQNDNTKEVIQAAELTNITSVGEGISNTPEKYSLSQNYPNPFNPSTTIEYQIPEMVNVNLVVYDILGRKVKTLVNEIQNAGNYKVTFNAEGIASGIYFYKLTAGNFTNIKKVVYIK